MPSLARTQHRALLLRTWHYERRQRCSIFCTLIFPSLLLILLSALSRSIKLRTVETFPFQEKPKGAFVARPFHPLRCLELALDIGFEAALARCGNPDDIQSYTIPVFSQPNPLIGSVNATAGTGEGLLGGFSLSPFIFPGAVEGGPGSFFETQTSYDGIFLHSYFEGDNTSELYRRSLDLAKTNQVDTFYKTETLPFETEEQFRDEFFNSWYDGNVGGIYSTGISVQRLTQSPDGDLDVGATVFFNESSTTNCTVACPRVANIIRTESAVYNLLNPGKFATAYLRRMPLIAGDVPLSFLRLVVSIVIGFTTHFLLPSFLRFLVLEREKRIRAMMSMMGLQRYRYLFGTYVGLYLQYVVSIAMIIIMGLVSGTKFFTLNTPVSFLVLFFLWGHVLIAFSLALAPLFTNAETAQVLCWLIVIIINFVGGPFLGQRLGDEEGTSESTWFAIMLLPSFAYLRSVYYAGAINAGDRGVVLGSEIYNGSELGMCRGEGPFCRSFAFLIVQWAILMLAALYFDRVLPTAVGNRLHPLFFFGFKRKTKIAADGKEVNDDNKGDDVIAEETRAASIVDNIQSERFDGVVLNKLSKTYNAKTPVRAVRGLSLVAQKNEVLGILAPNGSGKTSTFRTLVGELEATSGTAYITGSSILTEMDQVHRKLGVAPQQNILWNVLTVEEHLYFYGRVKNLQGKDLKAAVNQALESVQLAFARKRKVKNLSGGMKRRLSVSIAMIGTPDLIVCDEPSAGLDLVARERLWTAIEASKQDKVIILTTHSLEEAETLCDRVAIMSHGQLKAIGKVEELKLRLGRGHRLGVSLPASRMAELHDAVMNLAPGAEIDTRVGGNVEYVLPKSIAIPEIFALMGKKKDQLEVRDWAINQSTLEDVFLRVTKQAQLEEERLAVQAEP